MRRAGDEVYVEAALAELRDAALAECGLSRGRATPDLAAFVQAQGRAPWPAGVSHAYLLTERCDEVNDDGTRRRTHHEVVQVVDRSGAEALRESRIYYNPETESVSLRTARILRADGTLADAQLADAAPGRPSPRLLTFPALDRGDVLEIEYSVDRFRPDFFGDYFGAIIHLRRLAPIRRSRYVLITSQDRPHYLHLTGGAPPPAVREDPANRTVTRVWEMTDLPPIATEAFPPPDEELSPTVQVSTFRDWNALARWYWHLVAPQHAVTPAIRRQVELLTRGKTSDREKLAALYEFVTREVRNVALNIGEW